MQELRKSLREKDRLIENINVVVLNHEDDVKVCGRFRMGCCLVWYCVM